MRNRTTTIAVVIALAVLAAACSTASEAGETTVATTTATEPPPDPAEAAAATQQANLDAFLAQDLDAILATYAEDVEFFNDAMGTHWVGKARFESTMKTIFEMTDPDATEVVDSFVSDDGTRGVVLMHWIGSNGKDNPFDLTYVQLHVYEDGLIRLSRMYWEDQDVADQLNAGY